MAWVVEASWKKLTLTLESSGNQGNEGKIVRSVDTDPVELWLHDEREANHLLIRLMVLKSHKVQPGGRVVLRGDLR